MHSAVPLRLKKAQKQLAYLVSRTVLHIYLSVIGGDAHNREEPFF
jgi:hypothetical protein